MPDIIKREIIYVGYYFLVQLRQIFWYWMIGMLIGSVISVFFKDKIHNLMRNMKGNGSSLIGIVLASMLGIVPYMHNGDAIPSMEALRTNGWHPL